MLVKKGPKPVAIKIKKTNQKHCFTLHLMHKLSFTKSNPFSRCVTATQPSACNETITTVRVNCFHELPADVFIQLLICKRHDYITFRI